MLSSQLSRFVVVASLVGWAGSCQTTKESAGIKMVDSLVSSIESVQLEAELSHQAVYETLRSLHPIVAPGFNGDAAQAYAGFIQSVDAGELQAEALRSSIEPMRIAARDVFTKWEANLALFASEGMRARSEKRLHESRTRYDAVLTAAESSQVAFDAFNTSMRDVALYLGVDMNEGAVTEIEAEARELAASGTDLRATLELCIDAAQVYIQTAAPLGQLEVTIIEKSEPESAQDSKPQSKPQTKAQSQPAPYRAR